MIQPTVSSTEGQQLVSAPGKGPVTPVQALLKNRQGPVDVGWRQEGHTASKTPHQLPLMECTFHLLPFHHRHPFSCLRRIWWDAVKLDVWKAWVFVRLSLYHCQRKFRVNWLHVSRIRRMSWISKCDVVFWQASDLGLFWHDSCSWGSTKVPPCVWGECDFHVNWLHVSRIRPTHWRLNDDFDINQRRRHQIHVCGWYIKVYKNHQ